jgi:hypothetical protein
LAIQQATEPGPISMPAAGEITALLHDWKAGAPAAIDHLFELL